MLSIGEYTVYRNTSSTIYETVNKKSETVFKVLHTGMVTELFRGIKYNVVISDSLCPEIIGVETDVIYTPVSYHSLVKKEKYLSAKEIRVMTSTASDINGDTKGSLLYIGNPGIDTAISLLKTNNNKPDLLWVCDSLDKVKSYADTLKSYQGNVYIFTNQVGSVVDELMKVVGDKMMLFYSDMISIPFQLKSESNVKLVVGSGMDPGNAVSLYEIIRNIQTHKVK